MKKLFVVILLALTGCGPSKKEQLENLIENNLACVWSDKYQACFCFQDADGFSLIVLPNKTRLGCE